MTARPALQERRGFTLLAVLLALVGVSLLAGAGTLGTRRYVAAAANRIALTRAAWRSEDCVARARAAIERALSADGEDPTRLAARWRALDDSIAADAGLAAAPLCTATLRSSGDRLDINRATPTQIERLLVAVGVPELERDSLRDAILDWRDADTVPRPHGAEWAWYAGRHRRAPRDGAFAAPAELMRVRGVATLDGPTRDRLLGAVTVEWTRVDLARAPPVVLASLPGFSPEAIEALVELRSWGRDSVSLTRLASAVGGPARDSIAAHYSELVGLASDEPDAWILRAEGRAPEFAGREVIELRLVLAGTRAAVTRHRTWIE